MIVGFDPGSEYIGIATLRTTDAGEVATAEFHSIRCLSDPERTFRERVFPELDKLRRKATSILFVTEVPPPTSHEGQGHRIGQAAIGYPLGYCAGLAAAVFLSDPNLVHPVLRVPVTAWRDSMLVNAARDGCVLVRPGTKLARIGTKRRSDIDGTTRTGDGGFDVAWRSCAHLHRVATYAALLSPDMPTECPVCHPVAGATFDSVDDVRDEWKAAACRIAEHLHPEAYASLVADAKSRAKTVDLEHRLAGVPDACEALGMAYHGLLVSQRATA